MLDLGGGPSGRDLTLATAFQQVAELGVRIELNRLFQLLRERRRKNGGADC
jgi:hypothetical protein